MSINVLVLKIKMTVLIWVDLYMAVHDTPSDTAWTFATLFLSDNYIIVSLLSFLFSEIINYLFTSLIASTTEWQKALILSLLIRRPQPLISRLLLPCFRHPWRREHFPDAVARLWCRPYNKVSCHKARSFVSRFIKRIAVCPTLKRKLDFIGKTFAILSWDAQRARMIDADIEVSDHVIHSIGTHWL